MSIDQNPLYIQLSENLHPQDFEVLKQILINYEFDLSPTHGYFNERDFDLISEKAVTEFFDKIKKFDLKIIDGEDLRYLWQEILSQFQKNYWGFIKHQEKPTNHRAPKKIHLPLTPHSEIPQRPPKKISYKDSFFYIWSVLQAMIITKALILVFGNRLAKDDTPENRIIFGIIILFSFGSLFLFAWTRRKNPK
jgi:hypothetical protein